jgi:aminopeptidase-like protein
MSTFANPAACEPLARTAYELIRELYPICRSITGDGVRKTLDRLGEIVPLKRFEVPSGTPVFDWEVPNEWNVRAAWIRDPSGRTIADVAEHSLHLVSYSVPFRGRVPLDELKKHLHSLPQQPDWIPYRTSYYKEYWGFCLRHRDLERLQPGEYEVCVDTTLKAGHLSYAEAFIPGTSDREVLIYTHTCHPSLANDNLTGMSLAALLARELSRATRRLSYRIVFGPGTIGSLTWLAANEAHLDRIEHGLVMGLLGDPGVLTYKESRNGTAPIDRVARHVVKQVGNGARVTEWEPYGYDERQFCSPGFDLPVGRLTRSANGAYPEYHTSADNPGLVKVESLAESAFAALSIFDVLDANRVCQNLAPKGEPRLGKRGLYGSLGGPPPGEFENAVRWVLNQSDGSHDLLAIADRAALPFETIDTAARALEQVQLLGSRWPEREKKRGIRE